MKICARKCDECLYSNKRIVSASRAREIMRKVVREDGYFLCHKGSIRGEEVICAGSHPGNLVRVLGRIGGLIEVDPDTGLEVRKGEAIGGT